MASPFLSICIPTYRRPAMLAQTLESVASQITGETEVVVCEEPSDDTSTGEVIDAFRSRIPALIHHRNDKRLQFDRNFIKMLTLAGGEYCWPLSDDDQIEPGGIAHVIELLRAHRGITGVTLNRYAYDHTYTARAYERPFRQRESRDFHDLPTMLVTLMDQLGFVSGMVLKRAILAKVLADPRVEEYVGSGYIQFFIAMLMMKQEPNWLYDAERSVGWRRDNDSFIERGSLGRLDMDVQGYGRILSEFLPPNSTEYRDAIKEVVTRHVRHHVVQGKLAGAPAAFSVRALQLCLRHYATVPGFWTHVFPLILMPGPLVRFLRARVQRGRVAASS